MVALAWLVYRLTKSPVLLGTVGFMAQFPIFALATLGGVAADRFNRRGIILVTQTAAMLQALLLASLTFTENVEIWHIFVLALGIGTASAFDIPARQSFIVEIAGRKDLMNAIALNSSAFQTARMIGPAFAAFLLAAEQSEGVCFLINAASYLMMILGVLSMKGIASKNNKSVSSGLATDLKAGFRFVWRSIAIRYLLLFLAVSSFWGVSYIALMPVFSAEVLQSGPDGLGILMSASGFGSIAGALFVAARASQTGPTHIRRVALACGMGLGVTLIGFASSQHLWLSALLAAVAGGLVLTLASTTNACIQLMVPDELRGRIMSIFAVMYVGAYPFGHLFAGFLAENIGAPVAVMAAGALAITTSLVFARKIPALSPLSQGAGAEPRYVG
jgi:MFS family permease